MRDHARWWLGKVALVFGLALGLALALPAAAAPLDADLLLRGASIHDGSGAPAVGDVAVRDGRIVAVGKVEPGKIGRAIDCRGLAMAPRTDRRPPRTPTERSATRRFALPELPAQGCTTMSGPATAAASDAGKFLKDIDANGAGTNIAHRSGTAPCDKKPARAPRSTAEELDRMKRLVDEAMRPRRGACRPG